MANIRSANTMLKRVIDLLISFPAIILLSPLLVAIYIAIFLDIGRPVFFHQRRAGFRGKVFSMIKFRTMRDDFGINGELLPDSQRITRLGVMLRNTSLDELPELLNVIRGDMSLVGPRPLLEDYLPLYSDVQARRHEVLPGITGWAQINGRNAITWDKKFECDVWYVDNRTLFLDFKILLVTVIKVIVRENVVTRGEVSSPRFRGSSDDES